MTRLELRDVEARAQGRAILRVERLGIRAGETLAVLGANGAGKSTLLRVAGALRPFTGTVALDGRPASARELRTAAAAVLQRPLLLRGTVADNAGAALRFRGASRREARRRAGPWLERLGLSPLAGRDARSLSGGEAQRVSLARALAARPRVLLLDEPFASLDAPTRGELIADLRLALAGEGTAVLLVTHDRHEALAAAGRAVLLHAGTLRQEGPLAAVLDAPADADVARVLGFDNLLGAAAGAAPPPGPGELLAIRSDELRPLAPGEAAPAGAATLAATLARLLAAGDRTRVLADARGARVAASASLPAPAWLAELQPGAPLRLAAARFARVRAAPG